MREPRESQRLTLERRSDIGPKLGFSSGFRDEVSASGKQHDKRSERLELQLVAR